MYDWIYGLINAAVMPLRVIVNEVAGRISSIWSTITNTIGRWRNKADIWVSNLTSLMPATLRNGIAIFMTLRYLLFVYVPGVAAQKAAEVFTWAAGQLAELRAFLLGQLAELRDWAVSRVQDVIAFVGRVIDWAQARLDEILADLRRTMAHVFGPLGSPERLAAWILGPLIMALVGWVLDNIDTLAYEAFRRRRFLEQQSITVAERIVDRFI